MKNQLQKGKKYLTSFSVSVFILFHILCGKALKVLAMEETGLEGSASRYEEAVAAMSPQEAFFMLTDGTSCFIHWIMIALTVLIFLYQALRYLAGRHRRVRVKEFVPAGFYIVLMLVMLAFGNCYIDSIVMLGGTMIAIAGVFLTLVQYKKSVNLDFSCSQPHDNP